MKTIFTCLVLLATISNFVHADTMLAPADLDSTLRPLQEKYNLPGVVGAIIRGDQIVALGSVGVRKAGNSTPFLRTDLIHLGSDTKAMTAILIGQLIDKKLLTLDTRMSELFPEFAASMNPIMAEVTVRNLLDHNAAFPHDLDWWALNRTHLDLPSQRRLAVKQALSAAPANPPGKFFYSNISFVLLGAIVEAKTHLSWEAVIRRDIFQPLHMDSAGFGPPGTGGTMTQPWGHQLENGQLKSSQTDNAPVLGPAGTVHCSMGDWSKFIAEILHTAQGHATLVTSGTFAALTSPPPGQDYAGGWIVTRRPWAGGRTLTHSGSNTTWYCTVWIAPEKDFAILVATNVAGEKVAEAVDKGIGELINFNSHLAATP